MHIVVAGGHGKIAMLLHPILRERGHTVRALIRNPDHAEEVRQAGADPVVCDIEQVDDISEAVGKADAVVFAAGAGPGSGAARKLTMDRDGATKLIAAAKKNGIPRYVMISAMGADRPRPDAGDVFKVYLIAKAEADRAVRESGLDYTILRPGGLTDDAPTGRIALAPELPRGQIPRADVATAVAESLELPATIGKQWELVSGETSIREALERGEGA